MKRLRVILGFLLLGAIVNIAVAWVCVCWSETQLDNNFVKNMPWPSPVPMGWPETTTLRTGRGFGISKIRASGAAPANSYNRIRSSNQWVLQAGWPLRSLYEERHRTEVWGAYYGSMVASRPEIWSDGLRIPKWIPRRHYQGIRDFPTRPLQLGFTLNSIFYGGLLWSFAIAIAAQRRRTRIHRHQCPTCRYDLRGHDHEACPECGEECHSP